MKYRLCKSENFLMRNCAALLFITFKQVFIIFYKMLRYIIFKSSYNICTVITLFCGKTKHMVTYNGRKVPSFLFMENIFFTLDDLMHLDD